MPRPAATPFDPGRTFALRLQVRAAGRASPQPLAGRLEHVMSGRCADFADAAQLIQALNRLTAAAEAAAPLTLPPSSPSSPSPTPTTGEKP